MQEYAELYTKEKQDALDYCHKRMAESYNRVRELEGALKFEGEELGKRIEAHVKEIKEGKQKDARIKELEEEVRQFKKFDQC